MRAIIRGLLTLSTALVLAACGGGTTSTTPPTSAPGTVAAATGAPATAPATAAPVTAAAEVCEETTEATDVEASVGGFAWGAVTAKVGDVVTWTNGDSVPHKLAFDDGTCTMDGNITAGGTRSLVFTKAGTFAFHCTIHGQMPGEITIE
jgi:plastocyanin